MMRQHAQRNRGGISSKETHRLPRETARSARCGNRRIDRFASALASAILVLLLMPASAQTNQSDQDLQQAVELLPSPVEQNAGPPLTLTLADVLARAQRNSPAFQAAVTQAKVAREAHKQARAAMAPSFSYEMQYLNAEGNGISPVGRFVTQDGVHVYRAWLVMRQDMPGSFFLGAGPRKAAYQQAIAAAAEEVARRTLNVTVTQDYYALVVAERAYATAQQSLTNAQHFLQIATDLEKGGEVAHADVLRFQLQANQAERDLEDAELTMSQARLNLSVLLFPAFNENFTVVDDLDSPPELPPFPQVQAMAKNHNPDLAAALANYRSAGVDLSSAKAAFLPSFSLEVDYGIEANALAFYSVNTTKLGVRQPNLGYFATYSMSLPLWDWGSRWSQYRAAKDQKELAQLNLSFAQRQVLSNLYSYYDEAKVARNELASLERSVTLAEQNLNLVTLQYKAGEAAVLQVLDAETQLATARNSYAAGEAHYRSALATLETITGSF
jgi:outer membrane protein TolC